jgi:hypothetical protein
VEPPGRARLGRAWGCAARPHAAGRGRTGTGHRGLGRACRRRIVGRTAAGCARSTSDCRPVVGRCGGAGVGGSSDRRARRASGPVLERPYRCPRARSSASASTSPGGVATVERTGAGLDGLRTSCCGPGSLDRCGAGSGR